MNFRTAWLAALLAGCSAAPPREVPKEEPPPVVKKEEPAPVPVKPFTVVPAYFEYGMAEIRPDAREALKGAVDQLLARPEVRVTVEGHTDERGTDEYNIDLGWKRAYAVRDYLKRLGVEDARLYPISYGRARPAVVGSDESAWNKNRRVELTERH